METHTDKKNDIWAKRDTLKGYSAAAKLLVAQEKYDTVNEAIIAEFYRNETHTEFNTYKQWKEKGYQVRKGETAFFVWAKPLSAQQEETAPEDEEGKSRFFPLCFLFSNAQVDKIEEQ